MHQSQPRLAPVGRSEGSELAPSCYDWAPLADTQIVRRVAMQLAVHFRFVSRFRLRKRTVGGIPLDELISFSGDMAEQVKDIPDGSQVTIKVVP